MIIDILSMVKSWDMGYQFFFVIIIATLATFIGLAITGVVGDFLNCTIPTLAHGRPVETEDSSGESGK